MTSLNAEKNTLLISALFDHLTAALKAIDDAGCDIITKKRVREVHEIPGALWHIYDAHDADKIRDFLNKVILFLCLTQF